jgi:2-amino-4-hydroxy-6-hydroxymethyldihydropteridine diphosphokinase
MSVSTVYIAIGSNLGDREANCKRAVKLLAKIGEVSSISPLYDTAPWGVVDQPRFLNGALELRTSLKPPELLTAIKSIERRLGRVESTERRYGPRVIDLDIIFFGDMVIDNNDPNAQERLVIPHPLMQERAFVLAPLADIAPNIIHPVLKRSVNELFDSLPEIEKKSLMIIST